MSLNPKDTLKSILGEALTEFTDDQINNAITHNDSDALKAAHMLVLSKMAETSGEADINAGDLEVKSSQVAKNWELLAKQLSSAVEAQQSETKSINNAGCIAVDLK